jgi:hypothetical protein
MGGIICRLPLYMLCRYLLCLPIWSSVRYILRLPYIPSRAQYKDKRKVQESLLSHLCMFKRKLSESILAFSNFLALFNLSQSNYVKLE